MHEHTDIILERLRSKSTKNKRLQDCESFKCEKLFLERWFHCLACLKNLRTILNPRESMFERST